MIEIDGSFQEGGGQIVRTSIALSMLTQKPVRIKNVRAKRKKPGLLDQHLTAIKAASQICAANTGGVELGSGEFTFSPNAITSGNYYFDIGTAGSTTLVFQTILYGLAFQKEESRVRIKGGTHNPMAPTADFIKKTFLPVLSKFGITVDLKIEKHGFYPKGGGVLELIIRPMEANELKEVDLVTEPIINEVTAQVILSSLPEHIAKRELKVIAEAIKPLGKTSIQSVRALSPGNVVNIFAKSDILTETFSALGKRGLKAEAVSEIALESFKRYKKSKAAVAEHLADQILIPLALSRSGKFSTTKPSGHTITNIDTIEKFLDLRFNIEARQDDLHIISVNSN